MRARGVCRSGKRWLDCGMAATLPASDPDTDGLPAYPLSKTVAERAAWDVIRAQSGTELVVLNPGRR